MNRKKRKKSNRRHNAPAQSQTPQKEKKGRRNAKPVVTADDSGVRGPVQIDPNHVRRDARTVARYMRLGSVSMETAESAISDIYEIIGNRGNSPRDRVAAGKLLLEYTRMQIQLEEDRQPSSVSHAHVHIVADAERNRVAEVADRLGITIGVDDPLAGSAGADDARVEES